MGPRPMKPLVLLGTAAALCLLMQSITPDGQVNPVTQLILVAVALVCTLTGNDARGQGSSLLEQSGAFTRTSVPESGLSGKSTPDGLREMDTFAGALVIPPTSRCPTYGARRKSLDPFDIRAPTRPCSPARGAGGAALGGVPKGKLPPGFKESDTFAGCVTTFPTALCPRYGSEEITTKRVTVQGFPTSAPAAAAARHVPVTQGNPDSFEGIRMQAPPASCPTYGNTTTTSAPLVSPVAQAVASDSPSASPTFGRTMTMPCIVRRTSVALAIGKKVKPSETGATLPHIAELFPMGMTGEIVGFNRYGDPQVRVRGRTVALSTANICAV